MATRWTTSSSAYVYDFGSGEEWTATRGGGRGPRRCAAPARSGPKETIEILAFEATLTSLVAQHAAGVVGLAYRLRIMGSLALALCNLAAGRVDAVCSLKAARAVDIAAAQLLVRECGLAIDCPDAPPFGLAPPRHERATPAASPRPRPSCARSLYAALTG